MHIDARKLPNNTVIEGDVCIIGAGAAGISFALDWIDTNKKVILLEAGGFDYDDQVQDLYDGETTGQKYYPLRSTRLHHFGGATGHWAGMCSPFDPIDFKKRDWVPHSGWPISFDDLNPFYQKAHKPLLLGPYNYDVNFWRNKSPEMKSFPLDSDKVWNKMWQFSSARFGAVHREKILQAKNIYLYTYATATNILGNENISKISKVQVKNHAGKNISVQTKQYVMACGALQNARMLLASNSQQKSGLGNTFDNVGRYFMEHIEHASAELWCFKEMNWTQYKWPSGPIKARAELSITEEEQRRQKILNGTVSFVPLSAGRLLGSEIDLWTDKDPRKSSDAFSTSIQNAMKNSKLEKDERVQRSFTLFTRIEQAPNANSRVTLDTQKDALGVQKPILNWELSPIDKRSIRTIYQILGQQFGKSGVGRVKLNPFLRDDDDTTWPDDLNGGWHHMGTTRMSSDPKLGVVDKNCQVHGISNLFIAGSGCFTTSSAPNPTLTLVALTLRLSDYLKSTI